MSFENFVVRKFPSIVWNIGHLALCSQFVLLYSVATFQKDFENWSKSILNEFFSLMRDNQNFAKITSILCSSLLELSCEFIETKYYVISNFVYTELELTKYIKSFLKIENNKFCRNTWIIKRQNKVCCFSILGELNIIFF